MFLAPVVLAAPLTFRPLSLTAHTFTEDSFACSTTPSDTPLSSINPADISATFCPSKDTPGEYLDGLVKIEVDEGGSQGEGSCFQVSTAVKQVLARCGVYGRVKGKVWVGAGSMETEAVEVEVEGTARVGVWVVVG